jgi:hypothetical protein
MGEKEFRFRRIGFRGFPSFLGSGPLVQVRFRSALNRKIICIKMLRQPESGLSPSVPKPFVSE